MKLLIMQLSPTSYHFSPLWFKYFSQLRSYLITLKNNNDAKWSIYVKAYTLEFQV
jgi:hypothetical protein